MYITKIYLKKKLLPELNDLAIFIMIFNKKITSLPKYSIFLVNALLQAWFTYFMIISRGARLTLALKCCVYFIRVENVNSEGL